MAAPEEVADLARVAEAVQQAGIAVDEIALRRPTLDDAFLALTGHAATHEPSEPGPHGPVPEPEHREVTV